MAGKKEKPTKEVSPPDMVLFLLLAGILFGLMVWRHIHLPDEERPKTSVHGRLEAPLPTSLALLWPIRPIEPVRSIVYRKNAVKLRISGRRYKACLALC